MDKPKHGINPVHLRTFLAVSKHLSFTRAGEVLYLSQPAVSRQMQQLEQELAVRLFEQLGKSLHLTDAGRFLAGQAEHALAGLERLAESVSEHQSPANGTLRIGAATTPGFYLLPPLIGNFHRRFPRVQIQYQVDNTKCIEQKVLANEVDLGFIGCTPNSPELASEEIAEDEIVCFTSSSHALARKKRVSLESLQEHTWVLRQRGSATRDLFESWVTKAGGRIGHRIELGCPEAVRTMVASGIGFGCLSELAVADGLRRKRLIRIPLSGYRLRRKIYLVRHVEKAVSATMRAFQELVLDRLGETNGR